MRPRDLTAIAGLALCAAVLGCNALLGNADHELAADAASEVPGDGDSGAASTGSSGVSEATGGTTSGGTTSGGPTSGASSGGTAGATEAGGPSGSSSSGGDAGGPSGTPFQSCTPGGDGKTNCGSSMESCCATLGVDAGSFDRTYGGQTTAADPATVSAFRLDKYEVTIGRFRQFVEAWNGGAGYLPPAGSGKHTHLHGGLGLANTGGGYEAGWAMADNANVAPTDANLSCDYDSLWSSAPGGSETNPIGCVTWAEAYAFCIWDGGFLPSEAEWEFAAAGGSDQRAYPWGATFPDSSDLYAIVFCNYPYDVMCCDGPDNIAPVGSAPMGAGLWGQLDLAGNVQEWTLDAELPYADPCADCSDLQAASNRSVRGGSFTDGSDVSPPVREGFEPATRASQIGIRCARTP